MTKKKSDQPDSDAATPDTGTSNAGTSDGGTSDGGTPDAETTASKVRSGDDPLEPEERLGLPGHGMVSTGDETGDPSTEAAADDVEPSPLDPGTGGTPPDADQAGGDGWTDSSRRTGALDDGLVASEARDVPLAGGPSPEDLRMEDRDHGSTDPGRDSDHGRGHHDEEGASFATRALWGLLLLILGIGLGIWGAPRLAPLLPSGLAPVAAWLSPASAGDDEAVQALEARLAELEAEVEANAVVGTEPAELDPRVAELIAESQGMSQAEMEDLRAQVAQIDGATTRQRLDRVEASVEGTGAEFAAIKDQLANANLASNETSEEAVAQLDVYRAELDGLRAEVGTLSDDVSALGSRVDEAAAAAERQVEAAQVRVSQAEARVAEVEEEAAAAIDVAALEADLAEVRASVLSGAPFAEPLAALDAAPEVTVPGALQSVADTGVAGVVELRDRFGSSAHSAIRASVQASGEEGGVVARSRAFFGSQFASRSLTPQEGDDPDAVLSRMQDALAREDIRTAISEAEALPPEARDAIDDWLTDARQRVEAEDGLAALTADISAMN